MMTYHKCSEEEPIAKITFESGKIENLCFHCYGVIMRLQIPHTFEKIQKEGVGNGEGGVRDG